MTSPRSIGWRRTWSALRYSLTSLYVPENNRSNVPSADYHVASLRAKPNGVDTCTGYEKLNDQNDPAFNGDGGRRRNGSERVASAYVE